MLGLNSSDSIPQFKIDRVVVGDRVEYAFDHVASVDDIEGRTAIVVDDNVAPVSCDIEGVNIFSACEGIS